MRVLFAGTPEVAVPSLRAVLGSRHEVVAVLTRPDAPAGRGRRLTPSPVAEVAAEAGVEVLKPGRPRDPEFLDRLGELAPDCAPIVAYGGLIPPAALEVPKHGWVNLHFSLLPAWRGAAPVQHAVLAGDDITGACTFQLEEGLDTGPVYGLVTEEIRPTDTSGDLLHRLSLSGADLLVRTLDGIDDGSLRPQPQPSDGVSLAPKLTVDDARVDWSTPALRVDRVVRGCTPAPGAWTTFRGERLKLRPVQLERGRDGLAPGEVVVEKSGVRVGTGSHAVVLGEVQPQGKKAMPAADWARGVRPEPGERLGA
ncbi:methionyl-tRNA formyltransferase [Jiangella alba]|uniref:Methionyl-tRNA formyltransferase n=1 Tax=Jiangella alba TaxID=561176 RepID=A0A1H5LRC7_9ACTN|nr:methionyl-tRNA formyltransferase [Jiangella alba]SEE79067.1 methionyl-tRNA formyltransferase [Jiangella alba]